MDALIYILLALTSIVGLAFIVERGLALRWDKVVPPDIIKSLAECQTRGDVDKLRHVCKLKPSALGRLLLLASDQLDWPKADNVEALQTAARHEIVRLERGLVVLEIIVGIAPLLGLVGTIAGMMTVFSDLGQTGLNDAAKLAQGIALILRATLIGLLIAIPSLIAWSYFSKKVEVFAVEMEALCDDFIRKQYRNEKKNNPAMHFHVRKRRNTPTVIIVALVDVLIVLLIFLMVTTTFKQQPSLRLALPESSQAQKEGANENPPLAVSIDEKGGLRVGTPAMR